MRKEIKLLCETYLKKELSLSNYFIFEGPEHKDVGEYEIIDPKNLYGTQSGISRIDTPIISQKLSRNPDANKDLNEKEVEEIIDNDEYKFKAKAKKLVRKMLSIGLPLTFALLYNLQNISDLKPKQVEETKQQVEEIYKKHAEKPSEADAVKSEIKPEKEEVKDTEIAGEIEQKPIVSVDVDKEEKIDQPKWLSEVNKIKNKLFKKDDLYKHIKEIENITLFPYQDKKHISIAYGCQFIRNTKIEKLGKKSKEEKINWKELFYKKYYGYEGKALSDAIKSSDKKTQIEINELKEKAKSFEYENYLSIFNKNKKGIIWNVKKNIIEYNYKLIGKEDQGLVKREKYIFDRFAKIEVWSKVTGRKKLISGTKKEIEKRLSIYKRRLLKKANNLENYNGITKEDAIRCLDQYHVNTSDGSFVIAKKYFKNIEDYPADLRYIVYDIMYNGGVWTFKEGNYFDDLKEPILKAGEILKNISSKENVIKYNKEIEEIKRILKLKYGSGGGKRISSLLSLCDNLIVDTKLLKEVYSYLYTI